MENALRKIICDSLIFSNGYIKYLDNYVYKLGFFLPHICMYAEYTKSISVPH